MTPRTHLVAVPDGAGAAPPPDPRVRAAAAVLAGQDPVRVAADAGVDAAQVVRWSQALAAGGAGAVGGLGLPRPGTGPAAEAVPVEDFLSVVAHELRTPLTAARSALTVLARDDLRPDLRERVAGTVLARLSQLDRLTLDVLDAVAVVTGRAPLSLQRVDLAAVVETACHAAGGAALPAPPLHVRADPARLAVVVATLLEHAGRYAAPESLEVQVQPVPDAALLTVRLAGVASGPDRAAAAFEPFGAAARTDGNGLAMYLVRALAVAHGGAVGMAGSDGPEPVTVLWVRLPLHVGPTAAPEPDADRRPVLVTRHPDPDPAPRPAPREDLP